MADENVTLKAETGLTVAEKQRRVREVDFVTQFTHASLDKLVETLGVTQQVPVMDGTTIYVYTTTGTLADGTVEEGKIIPLSEYEVKKTPIGEITLKKWRKAVSAEAIKKAGAENAIQGTDTQMLRDIQAGIRKDFFSLINGITSEQGDAPWLGRGETGVNGDKTVPTHVSGKTLQEGLANAWAKLQGLYEDDTAEAVYFINPEDIAEYLGNASIQTQTVFGMNYVQDFLGLGTVVMTSQVEKGRFLATAKQNLILYYLDMGGDVATAFGLTTDETGYIGIKSGYQNEERAQIETLAMSGIKLCVEYAKGVVAGDISPIGGKGGFEVVSGDVDLGLGNKKAKDIVGSDIRCTLTGTRATIYGSSLLVQNWTEFSSTNNSGHFVAVKMPESIYGETVQLKTNGSVNTNGSSVTFTEGDPLLIMRIKEGKGRVTNVEKDGKVLLSIDYSNIDQIGRLITPIDDDDNEVGGLKVGETGSDTTEETKKTKK